MKNLKSIITAIAIIFVIGFTSCETETTSIEVEQPTLIQVTDEISVEVYKSDFNYATGEVAERTMANLREAGIQLPTDKSKTHLDRLYAITFEGNSTARVEDVCCYDFTERGDDAEIVAFCSIDGEVSGPYFYNDGCWTGPNGFDTCS